MSKSWAVKPNVFFYKVTIRLFDDDSIIEAEFQPHHRGNFLLDYLCDQLDINERDYYGLRFVDNFKQRHWLDLSKGIIKQVKDVDPLILALRFHWYPPPGSIDRLSYNGKCNLYQQLRRDLTHGRLYCSSGEAAALGALIVQDELGDYNPDLHQGDYVAALKLALRQTLELEKRVIDLHKKREPGLDVVSVFDEFIHIARSLETYGVDPHPVKDYNGTQLYVGINFSGLSTFSGGKRIQHFRWPEVQKLNFEGKMFIIHLQYTVDREIKKHTVGFKCPSMATCKFVWRCSIEQMLFFTLPNGQNASVVTGGGFFSHSKFRYTGRTEREILSESLQSLRQQNSTNSSPTKRKASSVPATPSSPTGDMIDIRYSSLPRSTMSEPLAGLTDHANAYCNENGIPLLETVSEENRRNPGESNDQLSDLYYRESFDHSSFDHSDGVQLQTTAINNNGDSRNNQQNMANSANAKSMKKFSLLNTFIPSFFFVIVAMSISTIFILETDSDVFNGVRNLPEMVSLRYQYYLPMKEFIASKIGELF